MPQGAAMADRQPTAPEDGQRDAAFSQ